MKLKMMTNSSSCCVVVFHLGQILMVKIVASEWCYFEGGKVLRSSFSFDMIQLLVDSKFKHMCTQKEEIFYINTQDLRKM